MREGGRSKIKSKAKDQEEEGKEYVPYPSEGQTRDQIGKAIGIHLSPFRPHRLCRS